VWNEYTPDELDEDYGALPMTLQLLYVSETYRGISSGNKWEGEFGTAC
jgi:hypothetical protein